jgi:hypothetical protein
MCTLVPAAETTIDFRSVQEHDARVLRLEFQDKDTFTLLSKSSITIGPHTVPAAVSYAYPWAIISVSDQSFWPGLVVDRSGSVFALERIEGQALSRPPAFFAFPSRPSRGVGIWPWLAGGERLPIKDPSALLVVFPGSSSSPSLEIPIAQSPAKADGHFFLPELGSGDYRLKLYSALASPALVHATLSPESAANIAFPTGPLVRGRVVRNSGGDQNDPIVVDLGLELFGAGATDIDPVEHFRTTTADDNGAFRMSVSMAAKYVLRVHWGSASAARTFAVDAAMNDVDLGEIVLTSGVALRGFLPSCQNGEAIMIPVPSATRPLDLGITTRRSRIDTGGHFAVQGLSPGEWSVLAKCAGALMDLTPSIVVIHEGADTVADFAVAHP